MNIFLGRGNVVEYNHDNFTYCQDILFLIAFIMCGIVLCRNLPSKTPEEEQKHRLEYEAMVEYAKKKGT